MKKLLFVFLLFWSLVSVAQTPGTAQNYTPIAQRYNWLAGYFRALGLPAGCGFPSFTTGQWTGAGAIRVDTCAGKIYFWTGSFWRALVDSVTLANFSGSDSTAIDSVYLTPDSLLVARHFTGKKDTIISLVGGGGGGANNYPTAITFNTANGIFTLDRNGLSSLTVDLDGRYLEATDTTGKWVNFIYSVSGENTDSLYQYKNGTATLIKVFDRKCGLVNGTGVVTWDSLLVFSVSPAIWYSCIDGTRYTSAQTNITLDPADVTDPRIDAIVLQDGTGPVKVTGTPNSSPSSPQIGANQILLTYIQVNANATTPTAVSNDTIYDQNVEWTASATGVTVNFANTTNPFHFTIAADVGPFTNGQSFKFVRSSTLDLTNYTVLKFYIRLKATFANTSQLQLAWLNGSTLVSNTVNLVNGTFGYSRTVIGSYQEIQIPLSAWALSSSTANTLRITLAGTNASGFYFDYAQLQTGVPQTGQPSVISITGDVTAPASSSVLNATVTGIRTKTIPALSAGVLKYNGTNWVFDNTITAINPGRGLIKTSSDTLKFSSFPRSNIALNTNSSYIPQWTWEVRAADVSYAIRSDGRSLFYIKDTLFAIGGFGNPGPTITDSIHYSIDKGITWNQYAIKFPYAFANVTTIKARYPGDYNYVFGNNNIGEPANSMIIRFKDLQHFDTVTSSVEYAPRNGFGAAQDQYGNLYIFGGQIGQDSTTAFHDVWMSTAQSGGANWTQIQTGQTWLGGELITTVQERDGYIYILNAGTSFNVPHKYSNLVRKIAVESIKDPNAWITLAPTPANIDSAIFAVTTLYKGNIIIGQGSKNNLNKNEYAYLDKDDNWHHLQNYLGFDTLTNGLLSTTHAGDMIVIGEKLYTGFGSGSDVFYALKDSVAVGAQLIKDLGIRKDFYLSSTIGYYDGIIGNNIKAGDYNASAGKFRRLSSDPAPYWVTSKTGDQWFGTNNLSTVGIDTSLNTGRQLVLKNNRDLFWYGNDAETNYVKFTSGNGNVFINNASSSVLAFSLGGSFKFSLENGFSYFALYNNLASNYTYFVDGNNNMGIGTTSPTASAQLHVGGTTKGTLLTPMSGTQMNAISGPANGLLVYNTDSSAYCFFNGSIWQKIASGSAGYTNLTQFVNQNNWKVFYSDGSGDVQELALGSTNGSYLRSNGATSAPSFTVPSIGEAKGFTAEAPTGSENIYMWVTPVDITISSVNAVLVGSSSPSITWNVVFSTDRRGVSPGYTAVFSSDKTTTSISSVDSYSSGFNDNTIPAGSIIILTTSASAGTVTQLGLTINFTVD